MIPHSKPSLGEAECDAVVRVLQSGQLGQGAEVAAFEAECAALVGRRYGVAASSGTAALHLALRGLGVDWDDAVGIPSYACAALLVAVRLQQGQPVLCDVGPDFNLMPDGIPVYCKTAIVPHLFGAPAWIPEGLDVVEDIAQSIGGDTGRATRVAVASFYATKLMTTGEGGMVLTDDEGLAEWVRDWRDYDNRDDAALRFPYKMTEFQAALGRVQLQRLPGFIARRREIAARYREAFTDLPLRLPDPDGHVFFRYAVATPHRDALESHLRGQGVEAKRPVYRPAHHDLGGDFPGAEAAHQECLSLPLYPALLEAEVACVIDSVRRFFG